ncbi:MAG: hypothetical protein JW829_13505 [Pirellulales bacterium]|nr:hypothetical protein [Pirellulales bacterium]
MEIAEDSVHPVRYRLTADQEARLFWWLRGQVARAQIRQTVTSARLRASLVLGLSLFFWCGLFALFYEAFQFLVMHMGQPGRSYHADTVRFIFHLFLASLNVMLILSAAIIFYGVLFRSSETRHLLTTPARPERIVLYKYQEAVFFSSWGFLLLGSPMMIAYGIVVSAPWYYYALLAPLLISFVYIPCGLGALICLLIVRFLPRLRRVAIGIVIAAVVIIGLKAVWATLAQEESSLFQRQWFNQTLERFQAVRSQCLPSTWLADSLLEAARTRRRTIGKDPLHESLKYLGVLASNAVMVHVVLVWTGGRLLRKAYCAVMGQGNRSNRRRSATLDRVVFLLLFMFPLQIRQLLIKDLRVFRRDPVQWSQFLIFFALLILYFFNMDRFNQGKNDVSTITWVNMVSFLNLAVVGLILSTFTTRFIYPMISLEGKRYWILGLLPLSRDTILWGKFLFAAGGSWLPCSLLILLSDMLLRASVLVILVHQYTCVLLCVGLASIAVGFGAAMPNLREESPSKIAAGFGGTLNLILSAIYILVVTLLTALPAHFYSMALDSGLGAAWLAKFSLRFWMIVGLSGAAFLAAIATYFPMRSGFRVFREMEF